ncbi:nucleotide exchange factor GrpE [Salinimicrobium xinjiangense]|uniref:nucleotide exchange factor GrpE n=1 Tax=Salinimicrobium xinjiangense TaxID=438596 RepID=UPI000421530C|nr:nucleotide exchange factor GrpE [Salinimicrobium xinjiangense]
MSKKDHTEENISQDENLKDQVEEILDDAIEEADHKDEENEKDSPEAGEASEKEKLKADLEKEKDKFLRLFAEFENYKRRTSKERVELFKTAGQDVISSMLPVLDDFDRGLNEIKKANDKELLKGVELIHNKLRETLRAKGLEQMEVKEGDAFDAEIHEAITQIPAPSDKLKGKVVDVVEKGYKLGDRIIRYPKVVTGK